MDERKADVTIEKAIDPDEVLDSPIALGVAAGKAEAFPFHLRMKVEGKEKPEWPVATFWLHPFNLKTAAELRELGIEPNPAIDDMAELAKQNRALAVRIVDKGKGWSNLHRIDGSRWLYHACPKEADGTEADPRVELSELGALFGLLKARAISAAVSIVDLEEGNSVSSSDMPMGVKVEPSEKPNVSPVS